MLHRTGPISLPVLDDNLEKIGEEKILTDRQYFDFIEKNKERAIQYLIGLRRMTHYT